MHTLILYFLLLLQPAERIDHKVTLTWKLSTSTYSGQNVYRQDCCGGFVLLKSLGKNAVSYVDNGVIGGETYNYYITVTYQGNESNPSSVAATTIPY